MNTLLKRFSAITLSALIACCLVAPIGASAASADTDSSLTQTNSCATGNEGAACEAGPGESACAQNILQCGTVRVIKSFITFFIAFAGLAVVISIIIGGIQYSTSSGDPSKAAAARRRIINAIIALVFFFFLFALLNFLVPGGPGVIQ